ncbi:unnamed protein product [Meganyctiphanes norvegica]|uniref:C-type lectin domain-containing protein n=1 Tax=Meganyctiphanes norvegica TaxID=48144 RepID=A0AAV2RBK8_MEGNR
MIPLSLMNKMMRLLHACLVYTLMGCAMLGVEAEFISLSRDDLKFLITEVSNFNSDLNCSLHIGTKEHLDVLATSIQKIAEALTYKKEMVEECRDCFTIDSQTYMAFPTRTGSWNDAKDFCEERGFVLPEPRDPKKLAKHLRAIIDVEQNYYWIGGRGDGTRINWLTGGAIDSNSKWWWSGHPGTMVTSGHCLVVVTHNNPNGHSTFYSPLCDQRNYFICEKV